MLHNGNENSDMSTTKIGFIYQMRSFLIKHIISKLPAPSTHPPPVMEFNSEKLFKQITDSLTEKL